MNLILKKFLQGAFMVKRFIGCALRIHLVMVVGKALRQRAAASITVTTPSTVTCVLISGQLKAATSGCGKAHRRVSITIWSGRSSRSRSFVMVGMKSSATVQQMQPLLSSMTSSSRQVSIPQPFRMPPSTPEIAELVDNQCDALAIGIFQQVADHGCLAPIRENP